MPCPYFCLPPTLRSSPDRPVSIAWRIADTMGRKSAMRFEGASAKTTHKLSGEMFCWNSRFRSIVTSTSKVP